MTESPSENAGEPPPAQTDAPGTVLDEDFTSDRVLTRAGNPYRITRTLRLSGCTVWLKPGVALVFEHSGLGIVVGGEGGGKLIAEGTAREPIIIATPSEPAAVASLGALSVGGAGADCFLKHVIITRGDNLPFASVELAAGARVSMENCTVESGTGPAIRLAAGAEIMRYADNTLSVRTPVAVALDADATLAGGEGNVVEGPGPARVEISGDAVSGERSWGDVGVPYVARRTIRLHAQPDADAPPVSLSLGTGVRLLFAEGAGVELSGPATLVTSGTETDPVVLRALPAPEGEAAARALPTWSGVLLGEGAAAQLKFTTITMGAAERAAVDVRRGASLSMTDSAVETSPKAGVHLEAGARLDAFARNRITGARGPAMVVPLAAAADLGSGNSAMDNERDVVVLVGTRLGESATWQNPGLPLAVDQDVTVAGADQEVATLTIGAGTTLLMGRGVTLYVGDASRAALSATGTSDEPVRFTAPEAEARAGYWDAIYFANSGSRSRLENVVIEYAGAENQAAVVVARGNEPTLVRPVISFSDGWGIFVERGGRISVTQPTFRGVRLGRIWREQ